MAKFKTKRVFLRLAAAAALGGCAMPLFSGPGRTWSDPGVAGETAVQVATVDWPELRGVITAIDGHPVGRDVGRAILAPGRHRLAYEDHAAEFGAPPAGTADLTLLAGHGYRFRLRLCYWCGPRRFAVWVDDVTTGELVWGKRPDWPGWFL